MKSIKSLTIKTIEPTTRHRSSVLFLHGLGGTSLSYETFLKPLSPIFPQVKFILPTAPKIKMSYCNEFMNSWYDIHGFGPEFNEDEIGVQESTKAVHELIDKEVESGIPSNKILLAGVSQGGALGLYAGLTYNRPLSGILALSTYLVLHKIIKMAPENLKTPILMCHGEADNVVPFKFGKMSYEHIKKSHDKIEFKSYKDMEHDSSLEEMIDIISFVSERLAEPVKH
jgi:lysophospholipase-2